MSQLTESDALTIAAGVRVGALRAIDVVEAAVARTERLNPILGAFARITAERARQVAARVDAEVSAGVARGALLGVPCPIKDLAAVAGVGVEAGSAALVGSVAQADDDIVGWLAKAGTVSTGKTATPEFGLPCYTEPEGSPPAVTPWDITRMAGGSSGGAAAAVASGMAPIAHASDGGGSIRIPASCCGLVGLKASRGRIGPGALRQPGPGLTTDGVVSRTVGDSAVALDVLAGRGVGLTYHAPAQQLSFLQSSRRDPGRLRIGVLTMPVIAEAEVHPVCLEAVDRAVTYLSSLGHDLVAAPVPFPVERWQAFESLWAVGAATIALPEGAESSLRPLTRWLRERGRAVSGTTYAEALAAVQRLTVEVALAWDGFDAVLTPTLAQPPLPIGALRNDDDPAADFAAQTRFTPWTSVANLSGRPAITLPVHTAHLGGVELPIGVMLTGRFGEEGLLLALAAQLEDSVGWRHPFLTADPVGSAVTGR
jgi:amidase